MNFGRQAEVFQLPHHRQYLFVVCNLMRHLLLILSLIICLTAKTQVKDTIFLKRILVDTPYHFYNAIYIDTTYRLQNRKLITNFSFSNYDSTTYFEELKNLKPLKKVNNLIRGFPKKWILLYKYKDDYYTYVPSEAGENYRFEITDSTTIDYTMEGPEPSKINKITRQTPTKIIIRRDNYWQGNIVKINILDRAKGIAVFTFSPTKYIKSEHKLLMVSVDKASNFKAIINFCETDKVAEFDFDKIDFSKLDQ